MEVTKASHQLTKALSNLAQAKIRIEVLANDKKVHPETRELLKRVNIHTGNAIAVFKSKLGLDYQKIFQEQVLDEDVSLQLEQISDLFLALPLGIRNQVETYIESLHRVYGNKS